MQHTHISLKHYLPGLSTDSAPHYPILPRGPPLATLAPNNIQLSEICERLVNQTPEQLLSQLEILEIMLFCWCPDQNPSSNSTITSKSKISPQNPKSHLKIQNLTSNPQKENVKPVEVVVEVCFWSVVFEVLCSCWGMSIAKRWLCFNAAQNRLKFLFEVFVWSFVWSCVQFLRDVSSETLTCF